MAKPDTDIIKTLEKQLSKTIPPKFLDYAVNSAFRCYAEIKCEAEKLARE